MYVQESSGTIHCKVCSGRSAGTHFGVHSCRACAAFFRRALTSKIKFECFKGCPNSHDCKKCRLDRCIVAGMIPTVNLRNKRSEHIEGMNNEGFSPVPAVLTTHPEITLLHRLMANYKDFARERLALEQEFLRSRNNLLPSPCQLAPPDEPHSFTVYVAKFNETNLIWKGAAERAVLFLSNSFEEMHVMDDQDKFALLQNFIFLLYCCEGFFRAAKTFKERPMETYFTSFTMTIRFSEYASFFEGSDEEKRSANIVNACRELNEQCRDLIVPVLDRLDLSEIEFVALLVIALWSTSAETNRDLAKVGDDYRHRVFQELHVLYRDEFKLDNYATRLGELMTLTNALQMCASAMLTELQFFNFFDVFEKDSFASMIVRKTKIKEEPMF